VEREERLRVIKTEASEGGKMNGSERQYSSLVVEESALARSSNPFSSIDIPSDPSAYFDKWLKELKPAADLNETTDIQHPPRTSEKRSALDEFRFEGTLRIDCFVAGRIRSATGTLIIAETGKAEADINVAVAIIEGEVRGNIHATECVEIANHASVIGNIEAGTISIQPGAVFEGRCNFLSNQRPSYTEASRSDSADSSIPQRPQSVRDQDEQQEESFFVAVSR
jgi:cytoskeletal protein CcmA (bactofilin family)